MLAKEWKRQGQLKYEISSLSRFQTSRWEYWEPWVDLRLHQGKIEGPSRKTAKNHFLSLHQSTLEYLFRLQIPVQTIRQWNLDNPLMTEDCRCLQVKSLQTYLMRSSGGKEPKKPRVRKPKYLRYFVDKPRKRQPKYSFMTPAEIELAIAEAKKPRERKRWKKPTHLLVVRCWQCRYAHHTLCVYKHCECPCDPERAERKAARRAKDVQRVRKKSGGFSHKVFCPNPGGQEARSLSQVFPGSYGSDAL